MTTQRATEARTARAAILAEWPDQFPDLFYLDQRMRALGGMPYTCTGDTDSGYISCYGFRDGSSLRADHRTALTEHERTRFMLGKLTTKQRTASRYEIRSFE